MRQTGATPAPAGVGRLCSALNPQCFNEALSRLYKPLRPCEHTKVGDVAAVGGIGKQSHQGRQAGIPVGADTLSQNGLGAPRMRQTGATLSPAGVGRLCSACNPRQSNEHVNRFTNLYDPANKDRSEGPCCVGPTAVWAPRS